VPRRLPETIAVDRGDSVRAGDSIAEIEAPEMLADETKLRARPNPPESNSSVCRRAESA
jgi:hypothetical protein